jgi:hypothetical protein
MTARRDFAAEQLDLKRIEGEAYLLPRARRRAEQKAVTPEKGIPLLAPLGQCASCDRRRALLSAAKRRHRKEKSGG